MLDLANEVAKLQGRLIQTTFIQKSHARARLALIEAVRFTKTLRKLAQSSDLQKNMDQ